MIKETVISRSLRQVFATGAAAGLGLLAMPALAQQVPDSSVMQRVEITGSSIKRIAAEGSLPVQTLTRAQIEQSGVSNVADLVAALPAMQGFITASTSVNGGGGGVQTASVHAIGTDYTLVLLNGRRMAPYGTGSAVNLAVDPAVRGRARRDPDRWRLDAVRLGRDRRRGQLHPEEEPAGL